MRLGNKIYIAIFIAVCGIFGYKSSDIKQLFSAQDTIYPVYESATMVAGFSPNGGIADLIVSSINSATSNILVEAYSFTSKPIAKALINAQERGVKIQVILDKSQALQKYSSANYLYTKKVPLHIDIVHALFHDKVMIIDGHKVITGSYNFTSAAENKNAENVVIIDSPSLARGYTADFEQNWEQSVGLDEFNTNYAAKYKTGKDNND